MSGAVTQLILALGMMTYMALVDVFQRVSSKRRRAHPVPQVRHGALAWKVASPPETYDQVILAVRHFHRLEASM